MLTKTTFDFLRELAKNNNREWFQANKPQYEAAKKETLDFIDKLIKSIAEFDDKLIGLQASECTFRIFRDVRFSKNKDPYKTNFGANMAEGGRKSMNAGYYIHIEPGKSFLAGGSYCPLPVDLHKIRQFIVSNSKDFFYVINNQKFKETFGEISSHGDQLVNVPKGFPKDHEAADYLKFKTFIASCEIKEADFGNIEKLSEKFSLIKPLNDFIRKAVS